MQIDSLEYMWIFIPESLNNSRFINKSENVLFIFSNPQMIFWSLGGTGGVNPTPDCSNLCLLLA